MAATAALRPTWAVRLLVVLALALSLTPVAAWGYEVPPEDYAPYQPQTRCRTVAKPGTARLATWVNRRFAGGTAVASVRGCRSGGTSEHKDGRAIDWSMDATRKADRREVRRFLDRLFAEDAEGHPHALARRMGVMYVIWNDRMWASYREFARTDYSVSVSCRTSRKACSATARHRDHVHISLSRPGARGATSWYAGRL